MCTLAWYRDRERRVVVANRDERSDRPATPPRLHRRGARRILAPVDQAAGGTWIGVNDRNLFAGITNRFGAPVDRRLPSRGRWVFEALACRTAEEAASRLALLRPDGENGFHLVVSDPDQTFLIWNDRTTLRVEPRGPGLHLVTERSLLDGPTERERWLAPRLAALPPGEAWLQPFGACRLDAPLDGAFVRSADGTYGTRSTTLIEWNEGLERYAHRDWSPKPLPFSRYEDLLDS
ncbi:MAG TPA: NRDE family protein [Myxococcales bacterium LLY-WYZ-16_1]|nr:NRDE family protein [Myxococcales bacterium LLY-WYZ-16_1]